MEPDIIQTSLGTLKREIQSGGRTKEALRSLHLLSSLIPIGAVAILHRTDCGIGAVYIEKIRQHIKACVGTESNDDMRVERIDIF